MNSWSIDINCDVGEGVVNESLLFPYLSSCNIACGGHTGTEATMQTSILKAIEHGVKIGVHPSYPDIANFGRLSMNIAPSELIVSIKEQLERFVTVLHKSDEVLHHIKPHGALYNDIAANHSLALVFLKAIDEYKEKCILYVPYASVISKEAISQGWNIKYEAFGDRSYTNALQLVSRKLPNSVLTEPEDVMLQIKEIVQKNRITTVKNDAVLIKADTICIHGDTLNILQILTYLSVELPKLNIQVD